MQTNPLTSGIGPAANPPAGGSARRPPPPAPPPAGGGNGGALFGALADTLKGATSPSALDEAIEQIAAFGETPEEAMAWIRNVAKVQEWFNQMAHEATNVLFKQRREQTERGLQDKRDALERLERAFETYERQDDSGKAAAQANFWQSFEDVYQLVAR